MGLNPEILQKTYESVMDLAVEKKLRTIVRILCTKIIFTYKYNIYNMY